jgi:hypothetical protein
MGFSMGFRMRRADRAIGAFAKTNRVLAPRLVATLVLAVLGVVPPVLASGGWAAQPAWASSTEPVKKKSRLLEESLTSDVSPFSPGSNNLSLDVGQVFLMGDLADDFNDNIGGRLHYTYGVSDIFGFDATFGYSSHSSGKMSMTTLLTGMRMNLAWFDKVIPHLNFGLGFYRPRYDVIVSGTRNPLSPILFGVHLGPGVSLELSRNAFFGASLTYHNIFSSQTILSDGSPFGVGGAYTTFFLNAGMTF